MSSVKDIRRQPGQWLELFDWFEEFPNETTWIPTATENEANGVRLEFYRARKNMQKDAGLGPLYPNADQRQATIQKQEDGTWRVVFTFHDNTKLARMLSEAIAASNARMAEKKKGK